jgi:hypothetical protein
VEELPRPGWLAGAMAGPSVLRGGGATVAVGGGVSRWGWEPRRRRLETLAPPPSL